MTEITSQSIFSKLRSKATYSPDIFGQIPSSGLLTTLLIWGFTRIRVISCYNRQINKTQRSQVDEMDLFLFESNSPRLSKMNDDQISNNSNLNQLPNNQDEIYKQQKSGNNNQGATLFSKKQQEGKLKSKEKIFPTFF